MNSGSERSYSTDQQKRTSTTVVVLSYNSKELLSEILPQLIRWTPTSETTQLLIADNCSTDDSVAYFRSNFPEIPLIEFEKNYGFAGGFNKALDLVNTDYVVPLSCDVEVSEGWLEPLVKALDEDPELGVCQPTIRSRINPENFEYAGAAGGYIDHLGIPFCRGRLFDAVEPDNGQYESADNLFWAGGCCFIIRTDLFKRLHGFDPDFFAHMEEIDLCWRTQRAGFKIGIERESKVYHEGGATLDYSSPRKLYLNYRNNYAMLFKNLPTTTLTKVLAVRIPMDLAAAFYFLFTRGISAFWAVIRAQLHFISGLPSLMKKRKELARYLPYVQAKGIFNDSVVRHHFLHGVKKFADLPKKFS